MPLRSPSLDDATRLHVLESFEPDALEDDPELAAMVGFAARLCDVPVSMVTLVEEARQRLLVREGIDERETPREVSFCTHAITSDEIMEVRDALDDPRFANNPLVTGSPDIRFYAGQPLISEEGAPLGTICVIDVKPRPEGLTDLQREGMAVLGVAVMRRLDARRADLRARRAIEEREMRLRRMIDGVPQIAWSADAAGIFDYFNRRWQELTGAVPPLLADDWRAFIHPEDQTQVFEKWQVSLDEGVEFEAQYRLRYADGNWGWVLGQAQPVTEGRGGTRRWFGTITDIDEVHRLSESRELLSKELSHRIKNIFAVVIGLAMLKARNTPEHLPFAEELTGTLRSLGRAHEFVRAGSGPVEENLQQLLAALFSPYSDQAGSPLVRLTGADCAIAPHTATPIALVFHELATNSAKYGALSCDGGHVELGIEDRGEALALVWCELGGPPVADGGKRGFGSRLVEMAVTGQLQGSWERHFLADGLRVELTIPKAVIAR